MDRGDPDRSSSKASSVSGRSQSAKSWNSLPPDERELANELHSQHLRLESRGSNVATRHSLETNSKLRKQLSETSRLAIAKADRRNSHTPSPHLQQSRGLLLTPGERGSRMHAAALAAAATSRFVPVRPWDQRAPQVLRKKPSKWRSYKRRIKRWKRPCGQGMLRQHR